MAQDIPLPESEKPPLVATASIPPPVNPETMAEKLPALQSSDSEELSKVPTNELEKQETEPEYPSMRRVVPIVAALYMSFFLVALVRSSFLLSQSCADMLVGSYNHSHCYPTNNRRLSFTRRCWMVRLSLYAYRLLLSAPYGSSLHLLRC